MNLSDQQKKLIAGGIALIAVVVIVFFVMRSRRRPPEAGLAAGGFAQTGEEVAGGAGQAGGPAVGEGAAGAARGARGGAAGAAGAGAAGLGAGAAGEAAVAPAQYPSIGVVKMGIGPAEPTREDPFVTFNPPPQPIPQEVLYPLPAVGLVAGGLRPGGITEVARVGNRRVAGVVFNDQAWAILEDEDGTAYVVKPGDVIQGIRITAIARDGILLRDSEGNRWEVPLRGLGPGGQAGGTETTAAAMPQVPPV
jgi:hypothetical protein